MSSVWCIHTPTLLSYCGEQEKEANVNILNSIQASVIHYEKEETYIIKW